MIKMSYVPGVMRNVLVSSRRHWEHLVDLEPLRSTRPGTCFLDQSKCVLKYPNHSLSLEQVCQSAEGGELGLNGGQVSGR